MNSLIKIDGKPVEKLIDVVSNAVGILFEPWQIVRKAKAEAKSESIIAVERAKTKALIDGDIEKAESLERINERLVNKEIRRQNNIENVVYAAGSVLEADNSVSEKPVNQDWATRFFDIVQDVSDNEMQNLWGQILAGEIKQPQSYSLRTLEILRNMTKEDAETFQKVAQFALRQGDSFLFTSDNVLEKFGVSYSNIAKLIEIGLLQPGDFVTRSYSTINSSDNKFGIIYGDLIIIINQKADAPKISISIRQFTTPGNELVKLINITPNINYIKELALRLKNDYVKVSYAKISGFEEDGDVNYNEPVIEL